MRTDVKVGLICAFAIVFCVVIYFVAKGKPAAPLAHADVSTSGPITPNSDLRVASPATPSNPVVTSDLLVPEHGLATGNPIGGGLIGPPGSTPSLPTTPASPGMSGLPTSPISPTTPMTPGMSGSVPVISSTPTSPTLPTPASPLYPPTTPSVIPTPSTPSLPTLVIGGGHGTSPVAGGTTYKIQKGDMLGAIAKQFNVSLKAIEAANPGIDATRLKVGAEIKIPAATVAAGSTTPSTVGTPTTPARTPAAGAHPVSTPVVVTIKPGSTYTIKKGDTLANIARAAYGTPTAGPKIFRANRDALNDPDVMPVGASIKIP